MTKKSSNDREAQKRISDHIKNRMTSIFAEREEFPTPMSIREVEALQNRVSELEAQLASREAAAQPRPLVSASPAQPVPITLKTQLPEKKTSRPAGQSLEHEQQNRNRLTTIILGVSLAFLAFAIWNLFVFQQGKMDVSDQLLIPLVVVMVGISFVSWRLVRRGRPTLGIWLSFIIVAIVPPIMAVLLLNNIAYSAVAFNITLSLILISLGFPKSSRWPAILVAAAAVGLVFAIDAWAPPFRLGSEMLGSFAPFVIAAAVLSVIAFLIRRAMIGNLRWKLVTAFLLTSLTAMTIVTYVAQQSLRANLLNKTGDSLTELANAKSIEVGQSLERQADLLSTLARDQMILKVTLSAQQSEPLSQSQIAYLDQQWREADELNVEANRLISRVLYNTGSYQLRQFRKKFPEHVELILTDMQGLSVASSNRTTDYYQGDEEWWQAVVERGLYIGQPLYDESSDSLSIVMATLVHDSRTEDVIGVLRTTVDLSALTASLQAGEFGNSGHTDIYLPNGLMIAVQRAEDRGKPVIELKPADLEISTLAAATGAYLEVEPNGIPSLGGQARLALLGEEDEEVRAVRDLNWRIIVLQDRAEAIGAINEQMRSVAIWVILILVATIVAAVVLAQFISAPLLRLNMVANRIASGDLAAEAKVETEDEVGMLSATFNEMTAQLRDLFGTLERRIEDRTHDLELASEVGRTVTSKFTNLNELLTSAVELIRTKFDLYYTQVYLMDPTGRRLVLRAGTGEVAQTLLERGHSLFLNSSSLNGRAALEKRAVIVSDTAASPNFRPNPLLPNTKSEMSVPLIAGDQVIGVLDMQSERPEAMNESNLPAFQALAAQLAIGIQNAALFMQAERARGDVEAQVRHLTEEGWRDYLDAIERGQKVGFAYDQQRVIPLDAANSDGFDAEHALYMPLTVMGAKVGAIEIGADSERPWSDREFEIVKAAAQRLGQHVENLRLLEQADRYRKEAEEVARRLTREGWEVYSRSRTDQAPGYLFDLSQVQPLTGGRNGNSQDSLKYPLIVREQPIGELAVESVSHAEGASEIITAVARQLSSHIENLRLTEQNVMRARQLETVADVSARTATLLDPDLLLQTVVDVTKERFGVYHAHIYLADESWQTLLLAAGAGEVGREMVAEHHTIDMQTEKSLVARAARDRKASIVNDVRSDPGFLPNPRLPGTRSEMAVPMIVGEKVVGVFDVQADAANHFSDEDAYIYTTLAAQVAVALQNARLYAEQAANVTQLRELDRLKSSFLANMSHELRTPLNSILGFTDVILDELDGPLTENMNNDLQLIHKNGQHLLNLINNVLDMAKIEAGRLNLSPERFKVHEVFEDVINISAPLAREKALDLFIAPESDSQAEIYADRIRIHQVMLNLVTNAMKFTDEGSVSISIAGRGENVLIAVRDTGMGIPPDHLESVFQEFSQVDTSATRKVGGTGLGLPISRQLVNMHGGRMWAESSGIPGQGSVFYVELPVEAKIETETVEKATR